MTFLGVEGRGDVGGKGRAFAERRGKKRTKCRKSEGNSMVGLFNDRK